MNAWNDEIGETATGNDWSRGVQILEFIESNADKYNEMTLLAEQQRSMIVEHEYAWNHAFVGWMSINKSLKTELDKLEKILAVAQERSEREVERHRIIKQRLVASRFMDWEATRARLIAIKNALVCKELKSELESLTSQCALTKKRDTYASIVAWHLYQEAKAHAYELHETMANLRNAVALDDNMRLLTIYKTLTRDWCATRDLLGELQLRLADKRGAVQNAGNNFKDWVYSTYIIPLLEKHINSFLSCVDDIRVRIQYHAKGLRFFVLDRGNETAYAASSGYQQFIVGLGMRQALANIGGAGNNMIKSNASKVLNGADFKVTYNFTMTSGSDDSNLVHGIMNSTSDTGFAGLTGITYQSSNDILIYDNYSGSGAPQATFSNSMMNQNGSNTAIFEKVGNVLTIKMNDVTIYTKNNHTEQTMVPAVRTWAIQALDSGYMLFAAPAVQLSWNNNSSGYIIESDNGVTTTAQRSSGPTYDVVFGNSESFVTGDFVYEAEISTSLQTESLVGFYDSIGGPYNTFVSGGANLYFLITDQWGSLATSVAKPTGSTFMFKITRAGTTVKLFVNNIEVASKSNTIIEHLKVPFFTLRPNDYIVSATISV
jgi:hypothetical protein